MRKTIATLTMLAVSAVLLPTAALAGDETAAIKTAIHDAYVDGIWLKGDEEAARKGFDPSFVMQVTEDDRTRSVSLDAWLERLGLHGEALDENITHEIQVLDQTGGAAVARVRVYSAGEPLYTDYMSLYKSAAGWRIVTKIFHTHR